MRFLLLSLLAVAMLCIYAVYWLTPQQPNQSQPSPLPRGGRHANDGRFHSDADSNSTSYRIHIYSSFYDDRPSLGSERRVVLVGLAYGEGLVDRCLLWYDGLHDNDVISVPATTIKVNLDYQVVFLCHLNAVPRHFNGTDNEIPVFVALAGRGLPGSGKTSYRVPVEPMRRVERGDGRRGRLLVCVAPVTGSPLSPRQLVEWIEMQRLLGVDGIVVYERAMSRRFRRALDGYRGIAASDDGFLLDVRQAQIGRGDAWECQVPAINDCMYRYGGRFDYVAAVDLDELIVPRGNFTDLVELFEHLSATVNRTVGQFTFANVLYLVGLPPDYRLLADSSSSSVNSSFYLSRLSTANVTPRGCAFKYVVDSDSCAAMWVHRCWTFTPRFASPSLLAGSRRSSLAVLDVDPDIGRKHHYRSKCNLDNYCGGSADECERAMRTPIVDEVVAKYGRQLTRRLAERYRQLADWLAD